MAILYVSADDTYTSISQAIIAVGVNDTIIIRENRLFYETWFDVAKSDFTIKSEETNPDLFPRLQIKMNANTQNNCHNITYEGLIFEKLTIETDATLSEWEIAQLEEPYFAYNSQNISFRRCVFRNYNKLISCHYEFGAATSFESCLFYNINSYIIDANKNFNYGSIVFDCCTFHDCGSVIGNNFNTDGFEKRMKFRNCIISQTAPGSIFAIDVETKYKIGLLNNVTYSVFTNNPTSTGVVLGTSCRVDVPIGEIFINETPGQPSHFQLNINIADSKVINKGSNDAWHFDITGFQRVDIFDIGAWEYGASPGITPDDPDVTGNSFWIM